MDTMEVLTSPKTVKKAERGVRILSDYAHLTMVKASVFLDDQLWLEAKIISRTPKNTSK